MKKVCHTNPLALAELCYRSTGCTGEVVEGPLTARECCVGTDDGHSYEVDGVCTVTECTGTNLMMVILLLPLILSSHCLYCLYLSVHGFEHPLYYLREGENLTTSFLREVKGATQFPFLQLYGGITSEADTAGEYTYIFAVSNVS